MDQKHIELPPGLLKNVLLRIEAEKKRLARIRLVFVSGTALVSFGTLIPSFQYLAADFYQSGFYHYLSLIFSDGGLAITYWKELILSLAESLPLFGATAVLTGIFFLIGSIKIMSQDIKIAFLSTRLTYIP